MLEKYFTEEDVTVTTTEDKGTHIAFTCTCPDWVNSVTLTISDIGIAKALGLEMKEYTREELVEEIRKSFPLTYGVYFLKDWEFPVPVEWSKSAAEHIETSKINKMFFAIDANYVRDLDPPLFALCFLRQVVGEYKRLPAWDSFLPSNLLNLVENPKQLFEVPITRIGG